VVSARYSFRKVLGLTTLTQSEGRDSGDDGPASTARPARGLVCRRRAVRRQHNQRRASRSPAKRGNWSPSTALTFSPPLALSRSPSPRPFLSPILFLHSRTMSAPGYYNSPPQMSQGGYFPPQQGAAPPRDGARFMYSSDFRSQAAPRRVATTPNSPSKHTRARPTAPRPKVTLNRVVTTPSSRRRRPSTCSCSAVYLRVP
jgi:hypothetical protein